MLFCLSMNLLSLLAFFVLVEEIVTMKDYGLFSNLSEAPLALIKKHESAKLELAIPQKSEEVWQYAEYPYSISGDKDTPIEKFTVACPARKSVFIERDLEIKWKKDYYVPEESTLFILDKYNGSKSMCGMDAKPSIEKSPKKNENEGVEYCGRSKAEIYNVGFPVSNEDLTYIQFIPIYKVCHSTSEDTGTGTLYTIHRITSPSLLLKEVWGFLRQRTEDLYKCFIDKSEFKEQLLFKNKHEYQLVGFDDMPTKVWGSATYFSFNYTPITNNEDSLTGMVIVDNYIRLYSKKTNKPLTLYSGTYQTTSHKTSTISLSPLGSKPTSVDSLWRIIMDDEGLTTMIVTQHTKITCIEDHFICHEDRAVLKKYKAGGCTYICSVNEEVIEKLGLPKNEIMERLELPGLKLAGILDLTFPRKFSSNLTSAAAGKGQTAQDDKPSEFVSLFDFFGKLDFESALENADPYLGAKVYGRAKKFEK